MNFVGESGFLTKDVEIKNVGNGNTVYSFRIAVRDRDKTHFFNVEAWNKVAEGISPYLLKTKGVEVIGKLKSEEWDDKTTGNKRYSVKIEATQINFLPGGKKKDEDSGEEESDDEVQKPEPKVKTSAGKAVSGKKTGKAAAPVAVAVETDTDEEDGDDEVPF